MRIWTKTLTARDLANACPAGVFIRGQREGSYGAPVNLHEGPRSRYFTGVTLGTEHGFRRGANASAAGLLPDHFPVDVAARCASFDEHGEWMAGIFRRDPQARVKSGINDFDGYVDFHRQTGGRYLYPAGRAVA